MKTTTAAALTPAEVASAWATLLQDTLDAWSASYQQTVSDYQESLGAGGAGWAWPLAPATPSRTRRRHRHGGGDQARHDRHDSHRSHDHHGCCCPDPCECCVGDADVVVETRVGEVRVLPLRVDNDTRRPVNVGVQAGAFQARCGPSTVTVGVTVEPSVPVEIAPCGHVEFLVTLTVAGPPPSQGTTVIPTELLSSCEVVYGELQVQGCDRRPLSVAVAVLPSVCDAVVVDCHCGCCC